MPNELGKSDSRRIALLLLALGVLPVSIWGLGSLLARMAAAADAPTPPAFYCTANLQRKAGNIAVHLMVCPEHCPTAIRITMEKLRIDSQELGGMPDMLGLSGGGCRTGMDFSVPDTFPRKNVLPVGYTLSFTYRGRVYTNTGTVFAIVR